jgi:hypothetical protein
MARQRRIGDKLFSWFGLRRRLWMGYGKHSHRCRLCKTTFVGVAVDKATRDAWGALHSGQCQLVRTGQRLLMGLVK